MISLKKVCRDEILQLALILSLLRVNHDPFENNFHHSIGNFDLDNGTSWRSITPSVLRSHYVHPKNLDSVLLNYEREIFADLNSLGRYNRNGFRHSDVATYLLNVERTGTPLLEESLPNEENPQPAVTEEIPLASSENEESNSANSNQIPDNDLQLTQEDMDLIEVLWKQDVDLGFSLDLARADKTEKEDEANNATEPTSSSESNHEDIEKLKTLKEINDNEDTSINNNENKIKDEVLDDIDLTNPWAGLNYTIDTETGEYVIKDDLDDSPPLGDLSLPPIPDLLLDEALSLYGLDEDIPETGVNVKEIENGSLNELTETDTPVSDLLAAVPSTSALDTLDTPRSPSSSKNLSELEDFLADMIQTPHFNHPHHRAFQSRMPYVRTVSMEQRWQDLANLLSLPSPADPNAMPHPFSHHHALHNYSHPHTHSMGYASDAARGVLIHNATLTPPMGDINGTVPYSNIGGTNLGNAVATSMNLTNSSEPMTEHNSGPHYKLEPTHDMMYYQNGSSEVNQTDGFLSSIFNDEDLQLMDMAMNEGMYTMRMMDNNNGISNLSMAGAAGPATMSRTEVERLDTSSDSAVSSMGSERVASLSDGEWCDAGSDSGHTTGDHYVTDYTKYRPFDYSYSSRQVNGTMGTSEVRMPPVAQKKHQMYGKRNFQEHGATSTIAHQPHTPIKYEYRDSAASSYNSTPIQAEGAVGPKPPELKYSCSMEFGRSPHIARNSIDHIQHNHTYHLPPESTGAMQRPITRDKSKGRKTEEEHLSRDEKRARALNVPITVNDIINLPMDEFNERLSKYDLSETQLSLIRDIRRRGKNKVAAQNCRKRKLDQILSLADEVKDMRDRKMRLVNEHEYVHSERERLKDKYQQLYRHVFQNLRDSEGNQYSPYQYSLQTSADGSILIVPRSSTVPNPERKDPPTQGHKNE